MAMSKLKMGAVAVLVIIAVVVLMVVGMYNNFVGLDQNVAGKWSEVENQFQRQADLIPNLVSVVSSSVSVETTFVKDVINARTKWQESSSVLEKEAAGVEMANGLNVLVNAVAENYPVLKANTQYVALTDELSGTQNRIAVARGNYIKAIQGFNTAIRSFPGNFFAGLFGFSGKEYYQADLNAVNTPVLGEGTLPQ